jgi:PAS domain S-box-containing protein
MKNIQSEKAQVYLQNILERIPGSIYWKNIDGVYLGCNQMQADMADFKSPEEMVGKTDYELPWKEVADILRATDKRIMETKNPDELIETPTLSDGTKLIMLTNKAPLYDEEGKVIGIIGTSLDITKRIEAEEREKTAQTAARAASEAQRKIAEEAKLAVMVLAGSIAHDLHTPLLTLTLINSRLKDYIPALLSVPSKQPSGAEPHSATPLSPLKVAEQEDILSMPQMIDQIIQDMHLFINHNLKALKHSNLDSLNTESLVICKSYKGINSALDSYPFSPEERQLVHLDTYHYFDFMGNPILFMQIMFNLLNNALYQIHKNSKGQVFITTEEQPEFNIIRFKDIAGGVPANVVDHIFDGYITTKKEGTGVGLAFCKLTMKSFGGEITCHSKEGDFIEFTLKFPKLS